VVSRQTGGGHSSAIKNQNKAIKIYSDEQHINEFDGNPLMQRSTIAGAGRVDGDYFQKDRRKKQGSQYKIRSQQKKTHTKGQMSMNVRTAAVPSKNSRYSSVMVRGQNLHHPLIEEMDSATRQKSSNKRAQL